MDEELDLARCSLRIKQDRRKGQTGIYLGFERRGRLNSSGEHTMPPSSLRSGDRSRTMGSRANRQTAGAMARTVTTCL
jgi:hypothetical protein